MVSRSIKRARRIAFIKSLLGHLSGVAVAFIGFYQDNPALGWAGAVSGVLLPLARNWFDTQNSNYGRTSKS